MSTYKYPLLALSLLLTACGGDDGSTGNSGRNGTNGVNGTNGTDGLNGQNSLAEQIRLAQGDAGCEFGGIRINTGTDDNNNGTLEENEVDASETVCASDMSFELQLLHFADIDGGRDIINNAVRFSALVKQFDSEFNNTILLSSGDNWIAGPEYSIAANESLASALGVPGAGRAHIAYLNELGVDATLFGNHEFDLGTGDIASMLKAEQDGDNIWPGAQFPYLSANLDFNQDENLKDLVGIDGARSVSLKNKIAKSTVVSINGEQIGVVGATTPTLASISSPGDDITITPADSSDTASLAAIIQTSVDALKAQGINKIILLSHMQQISIEKELAPLLSDVDIIVAGGSNTILADENDRLRDGDVAADSYPLAFNSVSNEPVLIVNTDGDYTYLGRLVVRFDENGVIIPESLDDLINGAYAADDQGMLENALAPSDAISGVVGVSDALNAELSNRAGNVFGLTEVYLNGARGSVRTEETNLGNLTAQANLEYAQQIDENVVLSLKNGGGIRAPIGACIIPAGGTGEDAVVCSAPKGTPGINNPGEISQLDLEISLRFNNDLSLMTLTGSQLKDIMEHAVSGTEAGATPGRFPQIAGMQFSFDPANTARSVEVDNEVTTVIEGERIQSLVILDDNGAVDGGNPIIVVQNGQLDALAATLQFRIQTLGFLAGGGDGYPFPTENANRVDLKEEGVKEGNVTFADNGTEQDALAEYLFTHFPADDDELTPAYTDADTAALEDINIQNLSVDGKVDTVIAP